MHGALKGNIAQEDVVPLFKRGIEAELKRRHWTSCAVLFASDCDEATPLMRAFVQEAGWQRIRYLAKRGGFSSTWHFGRPVYWTENRG